MQGVTRSFANQFDRRFVSVVVLPSLVVLVLLNVVPFALTLWNSFTDLSFTLPDRDGSFVGFENYRRLIAEDQRLASSVKSTLAFVGATLPAQFGLGLLIAVLLHHSRLSRRVLVPVIALPVILAPVTIGLVWKLLLHGDYGPAAHLLHGLGVFSESSILGTPTSAFWAIVLVEVWHWTPFFVVVLLAGLESIPPVTYEAARADGASEALIFRSITMPLLRPVILVALIFRFLDSFKEFDKVFVLTHGGPSSATEFLSVYCWIVSFEHGELGYGSAITGFAFLILFATCGVVIWRFRQS